MTRRRLFEHSFEQLAHTVGRVIGGRLDRVPRPCVRPPGALPEGLFRLSCARCHACVDACPEGAIDGLEIADPTIDGTPRLRPAERPCWWCEDTPCITACPHGALVRPPDTAPQAIARAHLDAEACLEAGGQPCDACVDACPPGIAAVTKTRGHVPVLSTGACVGCGLCVDRCAARTPAFSIAELG